MKKNMKTLLYVAIVVVVTMAIIYFVKKMQFNKDQENAEEKENFSLANLFNLFNNNEEETPAENGEDLGAIDENVEETDFTDGDQT